MIAAKPQIVKSFFDQTELYLHKDFGVRVRADIAQDLLGNACAGKKILDAGCGNGQVSLQFGTEAKCLHYLDISENMLQLAARAFPQNQMHKTAFFNCDFEEWEPLQRYDTVIAFGLLMHVNSAENSMRKLGAILEPGGRVLTQYTDVRHPISRLNRFFRGEKEYDLNQLHPAAFDKMAQQSGLKVVKKFRYSLLMSGMGRLPNEWLYRFHRETYKNQLVSKLGIDVVYLLEKV